MGVDVPAPRGNDWSHDADGMKGTDEYVRLCFRPTYPMELVARQEGRIADAVYLQVQPEVLALDGVLYTPDVANKSGVESYTLDEAREMIDFEILYTRTDWNDPEIQERLQRAERSEILVPHKIPSI